MVAFTNYPVVLLDKDHKERLSKKGNNRMLHNNLYRQLELEDIKSMKGSAKSTASTKSGTSNQ